MSGIVGKNLGRGSGVIAVTPVRGDAVSGSNLADDACDSEHYTDGSIDEAHLSDNAVSLAKMAGGTDGQIITYDASGNPVAVGPGTDGQVLTSTGAGSPPAFEAVSAGITAKMKIVDGSYAFSGAPGTQTISSVGFAPDAMYGMWGTGNNAAQGPCIFWAVNRDVSDFSTGTGSYMSCWQHNEQQSAGTWEYKNNYAIWEASYNNHFTATITTWGSDGITITYAETGTGSHTAINQQSIFFKFS